MTGARRLIDKPSGFWQKRYVDRLAVPVMIF
jgi:hypothetical protein